MIFLIVIQLAINIKWIFNYFNKKNPIVKYNKIIKKC